MTSGCETTSAGLYSTADATISDLRLIYQTALNKLKTNGTHCIYALTKIDNISMLEFMKKRGLLLAEGQPAKALLTVDAADEADDAPDCDLVVSAPWHHRGTVESAIVLRGGGHPVKRRGFVLLTGLALTAPAHQWLINEPGPLVSGLSGRRVSAALADRFMAMIPELRAMDDVAGGGTVLVLAQQEFGMIADLLDQASYDELTGRRLFVALAELGQLAGWTAYDAGQKGLAQRYYVAGLRAAHSADDRPLGAHILGSMAYQAAREGQPREAVTLVDTALAGVRGKETARLLTALYSRQAYAFATLGDSVGCTAAISNARAQVEKVTQDDPPYLYWVGPAEVIAGAGRCLLKLGKADQAAVMLAEGISLFDESFVRDRRNYLIRHAEALNHPGPQQDLDAAVEHGGIALALSEDACERAEIAVVGMVGEQPGRLKVAGDRFGAAVACPEAAGEGPQQGIVVSSPAELVAMHPKLVRRCRSAVPADARKSLSCLGRSGRVGAPPGTRTPNPLILGR
jgi:tetratricopeptide (TPR) repeat protein